MDPRRCDCLRCKRIRYAERPGETLCDRFCVEPVHPGLPRHQRRVAAEDGWVLIAGGSVGQAMQLGVV